MELDEFIDSLVAEHIARSLDEVVDVDKMERWRTGERADEEANRIVTAMIAKALEHKEAKNG